MPTTCIWLCSLVWRFAIRAVLQDLGRHRRWLTLPDLVKRRQRRLKYQQLYLKRVEKHSASKEAPNEVTAPSLWRSASSECRHCISDKFECDLAYAQVNVALHRCKGLNRLRMQSWKLWKLS